MLLYDFETSGISIARLFPLFKQRINIIRPRQHNVPLGKNLKVRKY